MNDYYYNHCKLQASTLIQNIKELTLKNKTLETQLTSVKEDLSKVISERDSMRNSLLEAEIANHESNNDRSKESENLKLELVKSQSAIETLEVTLSVRDNELKSKKEEIRKEKVSTFCKTITICN